MILLIVKRFNQRHTAWKIPPAALDGMPLPGELGYYDTVFDHCQYKVKDVIEKDDMCIYIANEYHEAREA